MIKLSVVDGKEGTARKTEKELIIISQQEKEGEIFLFSRKKNGESRGTK